MFFLKFGNDASGYIDREAAGSKFLTVTSGLTTGTTHILQIRPSSGKLDVLFQTSADDDQRIKYAQIDFNAASVSFAEVSPDDQKYGRSF